MTKREKNLSIFAKNGRAKVLFQPRIEWWYQWHKARGTLPPRYQKMSLMEFFDDLDVSIRYYAYHTGMPSELGIEYTKKIKIKEKIKGKEKVLIIDTPEGQLIRKLRQSSDGGWRTIQFPIKNTEDMKKAEYLFKNRHLIFIKENFERGSKFVGNRGEPQCFFPHSPYQSLALEWMGTENLVYALADIPEKVERVMRAIDESYDCFTQDIISYGKVKIMNFGENIDANIVSPRYFEKYCLPFYEKRSGQLRKQGIYTHIHIDGSFRSLLKYLKDLPFDGLEALTPLPQGDVAIEEMKQIIGDKILLDGIPAIMFLPNYPLDEFKDFVKRVIELFYGRLILGASDEVPPLADIERVRYVSEYCQDLENMNSNKS